MAKNLELVVYYNFGAFGAVYYNLGAESAFFLVNFGAFRRFLKSRRRCLFGAEGALYLSKALCKHLL